MVKSSESKVVNTVEVVDIEKPGEDPDIEDVEKPGEDPGFNQGRGKKRKPWVRKEKRKSKKKVKV